MELRDPTRANFGDVVDSILSGRGAFAPGASEALQALSAPAAPSPVAAASAPTPPSRPSDVTPTNPSGKTGVDARGSAPGKASDMNPIDRAVSIGALMGEETNIVGMGLVAASAMNRAERPSAFASKSAALGDVFSAPHKASSMVNAVRGKETLPNTNMARQYSTTLNTVDTKEAYKAFSTGVLAELGISKNLGAFAERYEKASVALDVATKARDMGIDLGVGVTNYGAGRSAAAVAGVGKNPAQFGDHFLGPFDPKEAVPKQADFASRFAAAAAITGVDVPEAFQAEMMAKTTPANVSAAASTLQRQAQDYMTDELGYDVMPGVNYNENVPRTGLNAVDVEDVSDNLPAGPKQGVSLAAQYGIVSTAPDIPLIDPAAVDLADVPGLIDGPTAATGARTSAPIAAFSADMLGAPQGFQGKMSPEDIQPAAPAPVDMTGVRQGMTEQQAIESWGLQNQRPAENVEIRPGVPGYGEDIDKAVDELQVDAVMHDKTATILHNNIGAVVGLPYPDAISDLQFEYEEKDPALRDFLNSEFAYAGDITAGILHDDPLASITPVSPASVSLHDVDVPNPPSVIDGPTAYSGQPTDAPLGAFSRDALGPEQSFSRDSSVLDGPTQATGAVRDAPLGAFSRDQLGPDQTFTSPEVASLFGGQPLGPAQSFGRDVAQPAGFNATAPSPQAQPSGYRTGTGEDPYSQPETVGPALSDYDWQGGDAIRTAQERLDATTRAANQNDQLVDRVQSSPFEASTTGFKGATADLSLPAPGSSLLSQASPDITTGLIGSAATDQVQEKATTAPVVGGMHSYEQATANFSPTLDGLPASAAATDGLTRPAGSFGINGMGNLAAAPLTKGPTAPAPTVAAVAAPRPSAAPAARPAAPKPAPAPAPKVDVKPLSQSSLAENVKTGTGAYAGYATAMDAMDAIGAGKAAMPGGVSAWDAKTAFSDSVYAGPAYNAVMDAVVKEGNYPERKDIDKGFYGELGLDPDKARATVNGAVQGFVTGGPLGALTGGVLGATGLGKKADEALDNFVKGAWDKITGSGNSEYGGSGMAGDTYSNDRGFTDPGGWSLGNVDAGLSGALADGSAYGGDPNTDSPQGSNYGGGW